MELLSSKNNSLRQARWNMIDKDKRKLWNGKVIANEREGNNQRESMKNLTSTKKIITDHLKL